MRQGNQRSYWGVLPGEVAHDPALTIAARYLYVILSSMAYKNGFCWPSNEDIASELELSKRRVVELLAMLRDAGYIKIIFKPYGKGERRYIYCGMFPERENLDPQNGEVPCENSPGEDAENFVPPCENSPTPHAKNTFSYRGRKIKEEKQKELTSKGSKTISSKKASKFELAEDAKPILNQYVGNDQELAAAMQDMIANRIELKATNSKRAIQAMLSELERLSGGSRANKLVLLRRAISSGWKTVYPMRADELPDQVRPKGSTASLPASDRVVEEEGTYLL